MKKLTGVPDFVTSWPGQELEPPQSAHFRRLTDSTASLLGKHARHSVLAKSHSDPQRRNEHDELAKAIRQVLESRGVKPVI